MGQGNTGVVLRSGAETTLRYLAAKRKNRETLTLKKSPKKQKHFEPSTDFSGATIISAVADIGEVNVRPNANTFSNVVPILTSAIIPAATVATAQCIPMGTIPVLENPVTLSNKAQDKGNNRLVITAFFAVVVFGLLVSFGGMNRQQDTIETLSTTNEAIIEPEIAFDSENALHQTTLHQTTKATEGKSSTNTNTPNKKISIELVQNIVELIQKEEFARDTTLQALLSVWQELNAGTRATLNSTPWFLRFVFALQKRARLYLQSPDSYHADYNIKFNPLLNLSVALNVMSEQGIESSVESYHSRQSQLVERLKSEIATIEQRSKKQASTDESIASFSKSFREQYDLKPVTIETTPQNTVRREQEINQAPVMTEPLHSTEGATESITAVELDTLVTRFTAAYEHGDLNILMSLFSPDAKTNDKSGWHGIREDYEKLFAASSFRLLNIIDMHWSSIHDSMKGIGDYEIAIAMDDAGNARTLHGKIQFVVSQVDNTLRITRLYHLER